MDRRQNNGSVKAVSPRHCPSDLCAAQLLFQLLCWTESLRQCPLHRCWRTTWTTRSKRRPTCSAQLHLPTHDLFWGKSEGPAPPPSSKISWSFDLAWNPEPTLTQLLNYIWLHRWYGLKLIYSSVRACVRTLVCVCVYAHAGMWEGGYSPWTGIQNPWPIDNRIQYLEHSAASDVSSV